MRNNLPVTNVEVKLDDHVLIVSTTDISAQTATNMNIPNNTNIFIIVAFGDSTTAPRGALKIYSQVLQDNLRIWKKSVKLPTKII